MLSGIAIVWRRLTEGNNEESRFKGLIGITRGQQERRIAVRKGSWVSSCSLAELEFTCRNRRKPCSVPGGATADTKHLNDRTQGMWKG